jgi:hypothetical protein
MATAVKTPNYTDEQTAAIKAAYLEVADKAYADRKAMVESLAEKFGKSAKSIVAKLTREGVYKAAEYVTKQGDKPEKKDDTATAIGAVLRLSEADTDSLAKANKRPLVAIMHALANSVPIEAETPEETKSKADSMADILSVITMDAEEAKSLTRVKASVLQKLAAFLTAPAE